MNSKHSINSNARLLIQEGQGRVQACGNDRDC